MDELETPTHRRLGVHLDKIFEEIGPAVESGEHISLNSMKKMLITSLDGKNYEEHDPSDALNHAFAILEYLSEQSPETAHAVNTAIFAITTAVLSSAVFSTNKAIEREMSTLKGIIAHNKLQSELTARAQEMAQDNWDADIDKKIRIGEMAQTVYAQLHTEGHSARLPGDPDAVRKWISAVAPPYARKGGRSKKQV